VDIKTSLMGRTVERADGVLNHSTPFFGYFFVYSAVSVTIIGWPVGHKIKRANVCGGLRVNGGAKTRTLLLKLKTAPLPIMDDVFCWCACCRTGTDPEAPSRKGVYALP
jgi:hypothetical protein